MFEGKIVVFLEIEAFILNFPAQPSTLVVQDRGVGGQQGEIGQPFELDWLD